MLAVMKIMHSSALTVLTVILVVATVGAWLFLDNARTCLSRDFVMHADDSVPAAVCWRQTNDYENVIDVSEQVYTFLFRLTLISAAVFFSLRYIRKGISESKYMFITGFLMAASACSLASVLIVFKVFDSTKFNNNNYALNTANQWAVHLGVPLVIIFFTGAVAFVANHPKRSVRLR